MEAIVLFILFIVGVTWVMYHQQPAVQKACPVEPPPLPKRISVEQFEELFAEALGLELKRSNLLPPEHLFLVLVWTATGIYQNTIAVEQVRRIALTSTEHISKACIRSFILLLEALPKDADGQFFQWIEAAIPKTLIPSLMAPFFDAGIEVVTKPYMDAAVKVTLQKRANADRLIYPDQFQGDAIKTYLSKTPLASLFNQITPFRLSASTRREHTFIVGPSGSGKTTLLSNLIAYDLQRVKDGTSLVIMDSQGLKGIAYNVARLRAFEPGGKLFGKLVYIHPDLPLAVNPFKYPPGETTLALQKYLIGGILDIPLTDLQSGPVEHILRLMQFCPNPSIHLFMEFFKYRAERGKRFSVPNEAAPHLHKLPVPSQNYFRDDFPYLPTQQRDFIAQKTQTLLSKRAFQNILGADNSFNLSQQLNSGKVVVIDADVSKLGDKRAVAAYGKFFIALMNLATLDRFDTPEDKLNHLWFYIDEAHDFIAEDQHVTDIIDQARKQALGLTVATLRKGKITNPATLAALDEAHIQIRCIKPPKDLFGEAEVSFRGGPPHQILTSPVRFTEMEKMPEEAFKALYAQQKEEDDIPDLPDVL